MTTPEAKQDAGADAGVAELSFSECPLLTQSGNSAPGGETQVPAELDRQASPIRRLLAMTNQLQELRTATAECATAQLPAEWSRLDGDRIDVFVKRIPAKQPPAKGQLWLLQGGPGFAGSSLEALAFVLADTFPSLDFYLPDHRGTGRSTRLDCNLTAADCVESNPHANGLTITDAARDVGWLIDATHSPSQSVYVYGVSYGALWAMRYLLLHPTQARAAILDSVVPPDYDWSDSDKNDDTMARRVLAMCEADQSCSQKFGMAPLAAAERAMELTRSGKCKLPSALPRLSRYFGALVASRVCLPLLPASVYRVLRCDEADLTWLKNVWSFMSWRKPLFMASASLPLLNHIVLSELWHPDVSYEELSSQEEGLLASEASSIFGTLADSWPKYPRDEHYGVWPKPEIPLLALQGGIDPLTPYGELVKAHYASDEHYYVELPYGSHAVLAPENAPMSDMSEAGCGAQVLQSFINDPSQAPDTTCVDNMAKVDFFSVPQPWLDLMGIRDIWDNPKQ